MKKCPRCGRSFPDATLLFCTEDGTPLVDAPQFAPDNRGFTAAAPPPKSSAVVQTILVLAAVFAGILFAVGGVAIYFAMQDDRPTNDNRQIAAASPAPTAIDAPTPKPSAAKSPDKPVTLTVPSITPVKPSASPSASAAAGKSYKITQTDDGYTVVRAAPQRSSAERGRLYPGTKITCQRTVTGEAVNGTKDWAYCPDVGGYILLALLEPQ